MATFSSKQEKKQSLILASITLIGVLVTFSPFNSNMYSSIRNALFTQGNTAVEVPINFASDLQYWNANCNHGWRSDSTCDALVLKTQACSVGIGSAYCSEYNTYLRQFRNQQNRISY